MSEPQRKRARSFECREESWLSLELLARDLECSIDYLINEAVKQYLRNRGTRQAVSPRPPPPPPAPMYAPPHPFMPAQPMVPSQPFPPPPPRVTPPPFPQPAPSRAFPPMMPPGPPPPPPPPLPQIARLALLYRGQKRVVDKPAYVIGRGRQGVDFVIKDPNVSRHHAMIEAVEGRFYLVDMGSVNGVEVAGQKIARRAIQEGDVARICDHEVVFTYR